MRHDRRFHEHQQAELAHLPRTTVRTANAAPHRKLTPTPGLQHMTVRYVHCARLAARGDDKHDLPPRAHCARCPPPPTPWRCLTSLKGASPPPPMLPAARACRPLPAHAALARRLPSAHFPLHAPPVALDPPRAPARRARSFARHTRPPTAARCAHVAQDLSPAVHRLLPGTRRTPPAMPHTAHYTGRSPLPARVQRTSGHLKLIPSVLVARLTRNPRFHCVLQYYALYLVAAPTLVLWFCDAPQTSVADLNLDPAVFVDASDDGKVEEDWLDSPSAISQDEGRGGEFLAAAPYFRTLPIPNLTVNLTGNNKSARLEACSMSSASTALKVDPFDTLLFRYAYFPHPTPSNYSSSPRPSSTHTPPLHRAHQITAIALDSDDHDRGLQSVPRGIIL
ncbi:hypothetical protein GGX14DRAFT_553465 [Mycena pura]|uniref:Uncharacterized protein n=1 Tax=Mycena pura TaxID=153505 RepID=A0AAD6YUB9_9AGAR|nr:hypothetical protein GGX14DRAFT_553465 [Mycena pura]